MLKPCRKILGCPFSLIALLTCLSAGAPASAQGVGSPAGCLAWASTLVPFDSVYYVSATYPGGDRLVVGNMSLSTYATLRSQIPAPAFVNQQFCGPVKLATGIYARAYVPTASEWAGDFSYSQGVLRDPFTSQTPNPADGLPFAGNIIPSSRIPLTFAWRISGYTTTSSGPLRFVPVTPCRIADTRGPAGPFGAPALAGQASRDFAIPNGACEVPVIAQAYSLNFTVVPNAKLQFLTVFPAGQQQPLASTLNSFDGRIKANAAIVPAGTNGGISVFATDAIHLVIDINGYFVPDSDQTALAFYPVTPCRLVDTREPSGAPILSAGQERAFPILSSSCGIPPEARAYALNYTVIPNGPLIYLTTWPSGQPRPVVSTLNAPTGSITANAAVVPAGDGGSVSVYATQDTHLVIDVNGYFAPPQSNGLSLYTVTPCRVYDSRAQAGASPLSNTAILKVGNAGCGTLPFAKSFVLNSTVVPVGPLLYLALWGDGGAGQPNTSALNAPDGMVTSNLSFVPTTNGSVSAFASEQTHLILDVAGYFAP